MDSQAPPADDSLRLFFALSLAEELRAPVLEAQRQISLADAKAKWVEPQNLHFTLKFLGETPAAMVPKLSTVAAQVAENHGAFSLHIAGAGVFPPRGDPRTIWLGCREGAEQLTALATDLDSALAESALAPKEKRPFKAHLTIGRNKSRHRARELVNAVQDAAQVEIGAMSADHFVLMRSQLRPGGPEYTVLASFDLAAT